MFETTLVLMQGRSCLGQIKVEASNYTPIDNNQNRFHYIVPTGQFERSHKIRGCHTTRKKTIV